jgi:hypothetical protein
MNKFGKGVVVSALVGIGTYILGEKFGEDIACEKIGRGFERMFEGDLSAGQHRDENGDLVMHADLSKVWKGVDVPCPFSDFSITKKKEEADKKFGSEFGY